MILEDNKGLNKIVSLLRMMHCETLLHFRLRDARRELAIDAVCVSLDDLGAESQLRNG